MNDSKGESLDYQAFWSMGGKQAFWPTREISYRIGAVFALVAHRLGLTPNVISICSFLSSMGGLFVGFFLDGWLQLVVVVGSLQVGFGLDCADGCLARATGSGTVFGALLDKSLDAFMMIMIPVALWFAPGVDEGRDHSVGMVLGAMISFRVTLTWFMVMKEEKMHKGDRLRFDERKRTLKWRLKRAVGSLFDEALYRLLLGVAFVGGWYQQFACFYCVIMFLMLVPYVIRSKREMELAEQEPRSRDD
jgi:phosphatidylglycerophosphate synthase